MFQVVGKLETQSDICMVSVKTPGVKRKIVQSGQDNFIITQKESPRKSTMPTGQKSNWQQLGTSRGSKLRGQSDEREKTFNCLVCNIKYDERSHLLSHLNVDHNVTLYKCDFCEEKFADSAFRERHITKVHVRFPMETIEELEAPPNEDENEEADEELYDNLDPDDEEWRPRGEMEEEEEEEEVRKVVKSPKKVVSSPKNVEVKARQGFVGRPKMFGNKVGRPTNAALLEWRKRRAGSKVETQPIEVRMAAGSDDEEDVVDPWWAKPKEVPDERKVIKDVFKMCHICGEMRVTLGSHLRKVHTEFTNCPTCNGKIKVGEETPHRCPRRRPTYTCACGLEYTVREHMHGHMLEKESPKHQIQCRHCNLTFRDFQLYHDHQDASHPLPFICHVCAKPFSKKCNLKSHIYSIHVKEKPPMKCKMCGAECLGERNMKRHINHVHRKATRINCSICNISIFDKVSLRRHMMYKHGLKKEFVCNVCKREFATADALRYHITTHTGERPFPCPFCPKAFKINSELRKHYRAHKELTIKCPSCSVYCLNAEDLKAHLRRYPVHDVKFSADD
ncbi:histone-lysine N-methyltransferase PRDM9-like [Phlebotomus argentipes]|uniref:histone-lysine N-methyltransferase PRDM9-like n=1 Tax=Phlebotomus argentipes TaxID=94469 RepID=UPI002892EF2D|nr:histone-lysine N-methyltransferase PRDM9-like [Phlebotomus argentipes]